MTNSENGCPFTSFWTLKHPQHLLYILKEDLPRVRTMIYWPKHSSTENRPLSVQYHSNTISFVCFTSSCLQHLVQPPNRKVI